MLFQNQIGLSSLTASCFSKDDYLDFWTSTYLIHDGKICVAKQMHQRQICLVFTRAAGVIHPSWLGWSARWSTVLPREEGKMKVSQCCDGRAGSGDLCQDSPSECTRYKENFSLNHQCCCCRGFKSDNPNAAFSGSTQHIKTFKQAHSPSRDWINKSVFRQLCAIQHFAPGEIESLPSFKPPHKSCLRFFGLISEMGCFQS